MEKEPLYLLTGLGANEHIFRHVNSKNYDVKPIHWIPLLHNETLEMYAKRLVVQIDTTKPINLMGLSMGGMVACELNKILPVKKTFLISTIKHKNEKPKYFNVFKYLPIYRLFSVNIMLSFVPVLGWLGVRDSDLKREIIDMARSYNSTFIHRAIWAILHWNNTQSPQNYIHIHGTKDIVLTHKNAKNAELIPNGSHIMILTHFKSINEILNRHNTQDN